ncbi:hypothetical protein ACKFKG_19010 [Phormidesmis sp. 146-35]
MLNLDPPALTKFRRLLTSDRQPDPETVWQRAIALVGEGKSLVVSKMSV